MFISINFWFRPYEFLCSSLSFFEGKGSIQSINKYHFQMVKIVSVSPSIFTSQNALKNGINIMTIDQRNLASTRMCVWGSSVKIGRLTDMRYSMDGIHSSMYKTIFQLPVAYHLE